MEESDHAKWSDQGTPCGSRNSVDGSVTPAADEKLLNDAETGVSEFLPCADFMGPGISPSPCFSLSDSPLGLTFFFFFKYFPSFTFYMCIS